MLKSLWVSRAAWAWIAATTRGWLWPTLRQPTPPTRSMNIRPSTSQNRAPSPRTAKMGACSGIASGATRAFRAGQSPGAGPPRGAAGGRRPPRVDHDNAHVATLRRPIHHGGVDDQQPLAAHARLELVHGRPVHDDHTGRVGDDRRPDRPPGDDRTPRGPAPPPPP